MNRLLEIDPDCPEYSDDVHQATWHHQPLHSSPAGRRYGRIGGGLPITKGVAERILRLPMHLGMDDRDATHIAGKVREFYASKR